MVAHVMDGGVHDGSHVSAVRPCVFTQGLPVRSGQPHFLRVTAQGVLLLVDPGFPLDSRDRRTMHGRQYLRPPLSQMLAGSVRSWPHLQTFASFLPFGRGR